MSDEAFLMLQIDEINEHLDKHPEMNQDEKEEETVAWIGRHAAKLREIVL